MVENKLGIFDGEVLGITVGVSERCELGGDEGSGQVLSGGYAEVTIYGNLEDGSEDMEDSEI